jgi:hypothetical protein
MPTAADDLVAAYLAQLQDELRNVRAAVRGRVVREIAVRIADERAAGRETREVLDEGGDPLDIAADVRERHGVVERSSWREIAAIVLLPFGGVVIPIGGWLVGLYFLWSSPVWTVREKLAATLVLPFGTLAPLLLIARGSLYALLLLLPFATSAYLALRLRAVRV